MKIFKLPDLGEGLPDATIIKWHVEVGQEVDIDQLILTVESAKAAVDIPASFQGKIIKMFGYTGESIKTGEPLIGYEGESLLKMYEDQGIVGKIANEDIYLPIANQRTTQKRRYSLEVKAFARKFDIDLDALVIEKEWVTIDDLKKIISGSETSCNKKVAVSGARLVMANRMVTSQKEVLPVTCSYDVNLQLWQEKQDITARVIRAIGNACSFVPILNATFHFATMEYELNENVNLGIAFDNEEGTYLPVIKNVNSLTLLEIRERINAFKGKIKNKSLSSEDCSFPTFLFSNFGSLGAEYANPIVIPPMVGIVGIGKLHERPVIINGTYKIIKVMPLMLTTNHILITGGEASRFLIHMVQDLEKSE